MNHKTWIKWVWLSRIIMITIRRVQLGRKKDFIKLIVSRSVLSWLVHLAWPYHTPVEVYNSPVSSDLLLQRTLTLPGRRKSTRNSQWPTKRAVYLNKEDRKKLEGHNRSNRTDRRTKWHAYHVDLQAYRLWYSILISWE